MPLPDLSRRSFVAGLPLALGACTTVPSPPDIVKPVFPPHLTAMYGVIQDGDIRIEALDLAKVRPALLRQLVQYPTAHRPGTIIINPGTHFLYHIQEDGMAMRYGCGVGKEGAGFAGDAVIARKAHWPRWTPTPGMLAREPARFSPYRNGLEGGLINPLGARALYLHRNGADTLFRIHGTNEPHTIGTSVSSGCIRLFQHDIIHLHDKVPLGTPVTVLATGKRAATADEAVY